MAAKIKLMRMGAKKQPTYRVAIQEQRSKRDGRFIEILGFYNPRTDPPTISLNQERVNYWLGVGAQPTESVGQLLKTAGITDRYYQPKAEKRTAEASQPGTPPGEQTAAVNAEGKSVPPHVSSDKAVEGGEPV